MVAASVNWPCGKIHEIVEFHAEVAFERLDELLVPLGDEMIVKRFHRRVAPEHPAGRLLGGDAHGGAVRHGEEGERVRRQEIFRGRDGGAEEGGGEKKRERREAQWRCGHFVKAGQN